MGFDKLGPGKEVWSTMEAVDAGPVRSNFQSKLAEFDQVGVLI